MAAIPYVSVQPNYAEVFSDVSSSTVAGEKVWLSYYAANAPSASVHIKLPLVPTKDDGKDAETQGAVRLGDVESSGGPTQGLKINRVAASWLDLELAQSEQGDKTHTRSARTLRSSIELDSGIQVRFAKRSLTRFLPTLATSKVNDNYTNYPSIDAFDLSLGSADEERDLFVAGGAEGALYTGRLAGQFDADEARAAALETLTDDERHILSGEAPDPEETKWDLEARIRLHVNAAKSRANKKTALKGHVGDVRFAKFFPSNRVVLSTSSDLTCRIWDAFTGDNPRTLQGHKRAVLGAGIIGRGRTLLTAGADGSVRLWDVAAPKQTRLFGSDRYSAVNCIALPTMDSADAEQSTFVAGLASGSWQMFDLRTATASLTQTKYAFPPGEAPSASDTWTQASTAGITAIDTADKAVVTATTNGIVSVWDTRALSSAPDASADPTQAPRGLLTSWRRNNAEITSLKIAPPTRAGDHLDVLVATLDGLPYRAGVAGNAPPQVRHEYAGWDCDPTSWIGLDAHGRTVIAGAEGSVRRY